MTTPPPLVLPEMAPAQFEAWRLLFRLDSVGVSWVLIGGQMMLLLATEHGVELPRATPDADVLVDVRASPKGIRKVCDWLDGEGLSLKSISGDGIGHRFWKPADGGTGDIEFDVLAPEGIGERADITTSGVSRTVQVPGSGPLLANASKVPVVCTSMMTGDTADGSVWRPALLDALIGKAAATTIPVRANPERDWQDIALLLSVLQDFSRVPHATKASRGHLRRAALLADPDHPAWAPFSPEQRRSGRAAAALIEQSLLR